MKHWIHLELIYVIWTATVRWSSPKLPARWPRFMEYMSLLAGDVQDIQPVGIPRIQWINRVEPRVGEKSAHCLDSIFETELKTSGRRESTTLNYYDDKRVTELHIMFITSVGFVVCIAVCTSQCKWQIAAWLHDSRNIIFRKPSSFWAQIGLTICSFESFFGLSSITSAMIATLHDHDDDGLREWEETVRYRREMEAWGERVGFQGCPVPKHPLKNVPYVCEPPFTFAQPNSSWSEDDKKKVIEMLTEHRWSPDKWNPFRYPDDEEGLPKWTPSPTPTRQSALKKTKKDKPNRHSSVAHDERRKPMERSPMPIRFYYDADGREFMYIRIVNDEKWWVYSVNHMIRFESIADAFCITFPCCTPPKTCTSDVGIMAVGWPMHWQSQMHS